ncbi:MAG: OmpA family protein [Desulfovibrionaceae bacterium]|nr:OmpA family protein [Desulfovibrionaceae bacterium]
MKKVLFLALLLTMAACAQVDPSLTDQTVVYRDAPVRKSPLQVSVHPKGRQYSPLTAFVRPFIIQQQTPDHVELADSIARIFHNAWTEERLFPVQEYQPGLRYQGLQYALARAREKGADLLVLGKVPYFYAGHTVDDTAVTLQVDIYAVNSGTLLWTMMQSGRMEEKPPKDFFYFRQETRLSTGAFNQVIRAIAKDMAVPLKAWLPNPDTRYGFVDNAEGVKAGLVPAADAGERDLTPENDADQSPSQRPLVRGVNLDVHFDFDKATIQPESHALLDALGEALNSPELKGKRILIGGHTDAKGGVEYNLVLSKKRAESVKQYLVDRWKIDPAVLDTTGYGKSRPLNQGLTEADQQRNRRVEIRLAQ